MEKNPSNFSYAKLRSKFFRLLWVKRVKLYNANLNQFKLDLLQIPVRHFSLPHLPFIWPLGGPWPPTPKNRLWKYWRGCVYIFQRAVTKCFVPHRGSALWVWISTNREQLSRRTGVRRARAWIRRCCVKSARARRWTAPKTRRSRMTHVAASAASQPMRAARPAQLAGTPTR